MCCEAEGEDCRESLDVACAIAPGAPMRSDATHAHWPWRAGICLHFARACVACAFVRCGMLAAPQMMSISMRFGLYRSPSVMMC